MTDPDELENLTPRPKLATPRCNTARHPADLRPLSANITETVLST